MILEIIEKVFDGAMINKAAVVVHVKIYDCIDAKITCDACDIGFIDGNLIIEDGANEYTLNCDGMSVVYREEEQAIVFTKDKVIYCLDFI